MAHANTAVNAAGMTMNDRAAIRTMSKSGEAQNYLQEHPKEKWTMRTQRKASWVDVLMCQCVAAVAGGDCVGCGGYGHPCVNAYGVTKTVAAVAAETMILRSAHYDAVVAVVVVAGELNDTLVLDLDPMPSRY